MAKSGIQHIDVGDELSKSEWLDEESHQFVHDTSFPGSPVERQVFYRDDEHKWYIYNGSAWKELSAEGVSTVLGLTDTPSSYSGQAGKYARVNTGEDALEFATPGGGGDMLKSVYDTDDDGIVDNSEKLEGSTKAQVQDHTPKAHNLGGAEHNADTKANLNAKVSDDTLVGQADVDDTPVNGATTDPISSNWAYDHKADGSAHQSNVITLTFIIDGGGSAITTGQKGHLEIPFACTITRVTLLADQSGSIVIDIWKDTCANFPPTVADTITASAKPTLSSAQKSQDSTLTGWTTAIAAGDILAFNVDSVATCERVTLSLKCTKT